MAREDLLVGLVAGVALAAVVPLAIIAAGPGRQPLARALARGGGVLAERARETFAELQEIAEDFLTEVRHANAEAAANAATAGATQATSVDTKAAPRPPRASRRRRDGGRAADARPASRA